MSEPAVLHRLALHSPAISPPSTLSCQPATVPETHLRTTAQDHWAGTPYTHPETLSKPMRLGCPLSLHVQGLGCMIPMASPALRFCEEGSDSRDLYENVFSLPLSIHPADKPGARAYLELDSVHR